MKELMKKMDDYTGKIDAQVKKRGRLQGRLEAGLEDLKRDDFNSEEEAQDFVDKNTEKLENMEAELSDDMGEFENAYAQYLE